MEIIENINGLTSEKTYQITIKPFEDINSQEIVECFKSQYPKQLAVILASKVTGVEVNMFIVGLNLKKKRSYNEN